MKDTPKINYSELIEALAEMKPRQRLYEIVKAEVKKRGHWKGKPRGKPQIPPKRPRL